MLLGSGILFCFCDVSSLFTVFAPVSMFKICLWSFPALVLDIASVLPESHFSQLQVLESSP